jgi:hypothetical protein
LHETQIEAFDDRAELADVEVAAAEAPRPSQEYVASRLHQTLAGHDAPAVVLLQAFARIRLKHRCLGFLDLQENRVGGGGEKERDTAVGADAAYADDLDRLIGSGRGI